MRKKLITAAAGLLMSVTASYAVTTLTIGGTFSLSYSPGTGGASGAPTFNSTPGDGNVGTGISSDLYGGNTFNSGSPSNIGFSQTLTVGAAPKTLNFFTANPAGTSGTCGTGNCVNTTNPLTGTKNTASGTITASFSFTTPTGATGNMSDTAGYYADYNTNSPTFAVPGGTCTGGSASQTDCIIWSTANDPIVINFSDGYTLTATLNNAQDWNITPTISLAVSQTHQSVPEPASLAVLGAGVVALGLARRRRK